ncbi:hypothetical protein BC332_07534 [Capsicum chinense]|nr:hypothetical protein BC332_07534 [Capsicum chinense]
MSLRRSPLSFPDIPTLKQVLLIGSLKEFVRASPMQIKETVEDIEGWDHIDLSTKISPSGNFGLNQAREWTNPWDKATESCSKENEIFEVLICLEINGYVIHENLEGLKTRVQLMANCVDQLYFLFRGSGDEYETYLEGDEDHDDKDIVRNSSYLLFLLVIVELKMQNFFFHELKASKICQSRTFKDDKLQKRFSHYLHNLLVYLRNEKLKNFSTNVIARNIDVAIEFLLVFLDDVPNHVINSKRLNEVLEKIGVIVGGMLCVIVG